MSSRSRHYPTTAKHLRLWQWVDGQWRDTEKVFEYLDDAEDYLANQPDGHVYWLLPKGQRPTRPPRNVLFTDEE